MSARRWLAAACAALLLAGCTSAPKKEFDRQSAGEIRKIALVQFPGPDKYHVIGASSVPGGFVLYAFGAIGGAVLGGIEGARMEMQASSLTKALNPHIADDLNQRFRVALESRLKARGYEVVRIAAPPDKKSMDTVIDYSVMAAGSHAVLEVMPTAWGYGRFEGGFHPFVAVRAQMVGLPSTPVHYAQTVVYGRGKVESIIWLTPDERFRVDDDLDKLYQSGPLAAEAVKEGLDRVAERIAADL